ncbi:MAG: glycosyltransferase family 9 protein [Candidatus Omnitrophica bacterium]|nr:glycosyltransferase family 9 protein [Candidatus Omnitrophota bacterium]
MRSLKRHYCFRHWTKRALAFCLDFLGFFLTFPFRIFRKTLPSKPVKRILLIRLDHIGDVVMTRPAMRNLRRRFPQAQIDLLISKDIIPLFEGDPVIDTMIGMDPHWFSRKPGWRKILPETRRILSYLRKKKYDLGIDFRGDVRHIALMSLAGIPYRLGYGITGGGFLLSRECDYDFSRHQVFNNLKLLECLGVEQIPESVPFVYSARREKEFWDKFAAEIGWIPRPHILIHAGAGYPSKRWPAGSFAALIHKILEEKLGQVVLIGTLDEISLLPEIMPAAGRLVDLRGKTSLGDLPVLFDHTDVFIGNDSGPAHIAAAQGLDSIVIFSGTNDAGVWHPWNERLRLMTHPVPCAPCEARECPLGHHACVDPISVENVSTALREVLKNKGQNSSERK